LMGGWKVDFKIGGSVGLNGWMLLAWFVLAVCC
jgi:hypothetical protein